MKNIYYKSDLKIIEGYPGTDDFLYHYFTQKGRETYDVSLAIGNCRVFEEENGDKKMVISLALKLITKLVPSSCVMI